MTEAEILAAPDVRGRYAILVYVQDACSLWSTNPTLRGAKIARANARRAAAKYGFTNVRLVAPDGAEVHAEFLSTPMHAIRRATTGAMERFNALDALDEASEGAGLDGLLG